MKSVNEEYQSVNEELQSSNEELETSKEEMQSINEELQTVNVELNSKNDALGRLNSDLKNLLESTQIATLFLDSSLHVSGFTPAISEMFHLREGDHGRPITEITARLPYPQLQSDVKQVLRTLAMVERVLPGGVDGAVYLLRMRPYRTTDNVIDGVVLTFIDITARQQQEYANGRIAAIVESSRDAIIAHSLEGTITTWNSGAERMFGYPAARIIGRSLAMLFPPGARGELDALLAAASDEKPMANEAIMTWLRQDGSDVTVSVRASPVLDPAGAVIGGSTIARDITEDTRTAFRLQESERRLADLVEQTTVGIAQVDRDGRFEGTNPRFCEIVGCSAEELRGKRFLDFVDPQDAGEGERLFKGLVAEDKPFQIEQRFVRADGERVWTNTHFSPINEAGQPWRAIAVVLDITQRKLASEQRELLVRELNHRVKNMLATVQAIAMQTMAHAEDKDDFGRTFFARLAALSRSHDLLVQDNWRGADLRALVRDELAPYVANDGAGQAIDGPSVNLSSREAIALGMALHELATNAAKYGALSEAGGMVRVHWEVERKPEGRWLALHWEEHDGPPVATPQRRGFGTRLVTDGIAHQLGGSVELEFAPDGVRCTIATPLSEGNAAS